MKPPAFQFYPKDFLTDDRVLEMSSEVRGLYITLLCVDWLNDGFNPHSALKLAGYSWIDEHGMLRGDSEGIEAELMRCFQPHPTKPEHVSNPRLQKERRAQEQRRIEGVKNGRKGGNPNFKKGRPNPYHKGADNGADKAKITTPSASASPSPVPPAQYAGGMGGASANEVSRPDLKEVQFHASQIGLGSWKAEDWYNEMEACGWLDHNHRPVRKWQPLLSRVKAKWDAEGRPTAPPGGKYADQRINPRNQGVARAGIDYGEAAKRKLERQMAQTANPPPPPPAGNGT